MPTPRLEKELAVLRRQYEALVFLEAGLWVNLPTYPFPENWSESAAPVAFQIGAVYPGSPPYGFYVPARLRYKGATPGWQNPPANKPPFEGDWAFFSWTIEGQWIAPTTDFIGGYNLHSFVESFAKRLGEGI